MKKNGTRQRGSLMIGVAVMLALVGVMMCRYRYEIASYVDVLNYRVQSIKKKWRDASMQVIENALIEQYRDELIQELEEKDVVLVTIQLPEKLHVIEVRHVDGELLTSRLPTSSIESAKA